MECLLKWASFLVSGQDRRNEASRGFEIKTCRRYGSDAQGLAMAPNSTAYSFQYASSITDSNVDSYLSYLWTLQYVP